MELGFRRRLTRDPNNLTPLYPLLGLPNDLHEGYQDFIDQKVDKPKTSVRRKILPPTEKSSRFNLLGTDQKSTRNLTAD